MTMFSAMQQENEAYADFVLHACLLGGRLECKTAADVTLTRILGGGCSQVVTWVQCTLALNQGMRKTLHHAMQVDYSLLLLAVDMLPQCGASSSCALIQTAWSQYSLPPKISLKNFMLPEHSDLHGLSRRMLTAPQQQSAYGRQRSSART